MPQKSERTGDDLLYRLAAHGSFIITDETGRELFRVTAEGDAVKVLGIAITPGGSGIPQGGPLTEDLDADGNKLVGLADPDDDQDAATKAYVDANAGGAGAVLTATVDLSAADIATPLSAPIEAIAAPGAGKVIVPIRASIEFAPGTVPFANDAALGLALGGHEVIELPSVGLDALDAMFGIGASVSVGPFDPADFENVPLMVQSDEDIALGPILTASIEDPGTGYAPGDTGTIGEGGATYEVDTVDGGGGVTAFTVTAPGTGYIVGNLPTTVTTGAGDAGLTINVDSVTLASDGTARITVAYYVMDLLA